jgi:hypothetical protein
MFRQILPIHANPIHADSRPIHGRISETYYVHDDFQKHALLDSRLIHADSRPIHGKN